MIKICIPSYKRPNEVLALNRVTPENQTKYFWLCVRDEEIEAYKENYPHCNLLSLGSEWLLTDNIKETRQRINEMMSGKILVIDDDIEFSKTVLKIEDWKGKPFHYMRYDKDLDCNDIIEEMLDYIDGLMDQYPHGSIRNHNNPRDGRKYLPYKLNSVCLWAVWFNLDMFDTDVVSYRHGPEMTEDVYMSCRFFELGYDLVLVSNYCIKRAKSTGSQKGGCSEITNRGEIHDQSVDQLLELFPSLCHIRKSIVYGGTKAVTVKFKRELTQKLF